MKNFFTGIILLVCAFLYFYKANVPELRGDEARSYISLVPFVNAALAGKFFPSFLAYFHEPLQLAVQLPVLIGGLNEGLVRLPNILSAVAVFFVLRKLGKFSGINSWLVVLLLAVYSVSGYLFLARRALNIGLFSLQISLYIYFFLKWIKWQRLRDFIWLSIVLFLAVFTYVDALFFLPGLIWLGFFRGGKSANREKKILFWLVALIALTFILWGGAVFAGSAFSARYSWQQVAPFRLLTRGAGGFQIGSVWSNVTTYMADIGWPVTLFLFIFLPVSLAVKKARDLWAIILIPTVFFLLVRDPTTHLLPFFPLFLLLAFHTVEAVWERANRFCQIILVAIISTVLVFSAKETLANLFSLTNAGYKAVGTFVRDQSNTCDYVYTQVEGSTERLYVGRRYQEKITDKVRFVLTDSRWKRPLGLIENGFRPRAQVTSGAVVTQVWERNYFGPMENLTRVNNNYFSLVNLMPYIARCEI